MFGTFAEVKAVFSRRGFSLNLGRGKTEGLPTFVEKGAKEIRLRMLIDPVLHGHQDLQLGGPINT